MSIDVTGNTKYTSMLGGLIKKNQVMGMPPKFTPLADPHGRVYTKLTSPPPIVSITPGSPQPTQLTKEQKDLAKYVVSQWSEQNPKNNQAVMEMVKQTIEQKNAVDARTIKFEPTPSEYYKTFQVILSRLASRFSNKGFSLPNNADMQQFGSLMFYLDKGTSFSESGSNQYDESLFNSLYKGASSLGNEASDFLREMNIGDMAAEKAARQKAIMDNAFNTRDSVFGKLGMALQGDSIMFPKTWRGAGFNRSYSLSFKFETPYGDKESVFREVYTPFAALLSMVLPKQTSLNAYTAPFIVRVDCPGLFTIDMGAITGFSINKSQEHLTYGGYTRSIEMTLEIEDLYSGLMASPDYATLAYNFGMAYYLDNLAVIDYTRAGQYGGIAEKMIGAAYTTSMGITGFGNTAVADLRAMFGNAAALGGIAGSTAR